MSTLLIINNDSLAVLGTLGHIHMLNSFAWQRCLSYLYSKTAKGIANTMDNLSDFNISSILHYLNAVDLANVAQAAKLFSIHVPDAVKFHLATTFGRFNTMKLDEYKESPMLLHLVEIKSIVSALSASQSVDSTSYLVSTSWVANAKKFYETRQLPDIRVLSRNPKHGTKSKGKLTPQKPTKRSDRVPSPTCNMTADITCIHGGLAPLSISKSKRRQVTSKVWHFLRVFFTEGFEFRGTDMECPICKASICSERVVSTVDKKQELKSIRKILFVPEELENLASRKNGIPSILARCRVAEQDNETNNSQLDGVVRTDSSPPSNLGNNVDYNSSIHAPSTAGTAFNSDNFRNSCVDANWEAVDEGDFELALALSLSMEQQGNAAIIADNNNCIESDTKGELPADIEHQFSRSQEQMVLLSRSNVASVQPLLPGIYHIAPRTWLKHWRHIAKDIGTSPSTLQPLDCTSLLCSAHGNLIIPPHLEEFLQGFRCHLLGNLGNYPLGGEIVEILSVCEWDSLQDMLSQQFSDPCGCDFNIRFCLDGWNVSWNIPVCRFCDPFNYNPANKARPGPNSQRK